MNETPAPLCRFHTEGFYCNTPCPACEARMNASATAARHAADIDYERAKARRPA